MKFGIDLTPELIPCRVYDAHGHEIIYVQEGDTVTGVCICIATDENGIIIIDDTAGEAQRTLVLAPPPLKLVHGRDNRGRS